MRDLTSFEWMMVVLIAWAFGVAVALLVLRIAVGTDDDVCNNCGSDDHTADDCTRWKFLP